MKLTQGSIVITAFPFADKSAQKVRPALVVSSNKFNENSPDVWIAVITTKSEHATYKIALSQSDLSQGALAKKSFVKFSSITYIEKHLFARKVAHIGPEKMREINKQITQLLKVSEA